DLTDKEWEIIEPLLQTLKKTRPPLWTKRQILDGVFYQLKNGCNWADLPKNLPPYSTIFWYYKHWCQEGILDNIKLLCIQLAQSGRARCPPHKHFEKILVQIKGATAYGQFAHALTKNTKYE
ncbi:MAG TPA: transposase, partial [Nostoc sp.]|uniref:transposase n=1 Tax=Nostoc sp. TaxID=1180 RepID=UPI002D33047E